MRRCHIDGVVEGSTEHVGFDGVIEGAAAAVSGRPWVGGEYSFVANVRITVPNDQPAPGSAAAAASSSSEAVAAASTDASTSADGGNGDGDLSAPLSREDKSRRTVGMNSQYAPVDEASTAVAVANGKRKAAAAADQRIGKQARI